MARCGCSSSECNCQVVAGDGVTVTGNGNAGTPYVVSADPADAVTVADTNSVNMTMVGNVITSDVIRDPSATNILQIGPNGVGVECEAVQDCVGQAMGNALTYNDAANQYDVQISTDPGNTVVLGTDNGIFSAPGAIALGCGLETGVGGVIQVNEVPFATLTRRTAGDSFENDGVTVPLAGACNLNGQGVYCDTNGELRTKPEKFVETGLMSFQEGFAPAQNIPFTTSEIVLPITNPSPCYAMCGYVTLAAILYETSTGNSNPQTFFQFDLGDGLGYQEFGVRMRDTRGISSVSQERTRFAAPLNVCLDPSETKNIRFRVRWDQGPVVAAGTTQILAAAREIRYFGVNI